MKILPLVLASIVATTSAYAEDFKVGALKIDQPRSHSMVPGAEVGDGYLTVTNSGTVADRLISASSPRAEMVQLHEMTVENGIMKMGELKGGLPIPAGETVSLAPHYHLMFMKIGKPFAKGEQFPATLVFEKAGSVDVLFDVGNIAGPLGQAESGSVGNEQAEPMDMPAMDMGTQAGGHTNDSRKTIIGVASIAGCFVAALVAVMCWVSAASVSAAAIDVPFSLIDDRGNRVDESIFKGHPALVYFGYTHCPEACPTTLLEVTDWLNALGDKGKPLRAYFFSIDPERDSQQVMHTYVSAFSPRIVGITGSPGEMKKASDNWLIHVRKLPSTDGNYHMDHTVSLVLVGADGRLKGLIPYGTDRATAIAKIKSTLLRLPPGA